jgi:hypothetical protein
MFAAIRRDSSLVSTQLFAPLGLHCKDAPLLGGLQQDALGFEVFRLLGSLFAFVRFGPEHGGRTHG